MATERTTQSAAETVYQAAPQRPTLAQPRAAGALMEQVLAETAMRGTFDPDMYHVMDREDSALIADEILHGAMSGAFVYSFNIQGKPVEGISVIGAAELASQYGGIKHRIITTIEKRGALFIFSSYPTVDRGMDITTRVMHDLADEMDFYKVVVEVDNIKNGNSIQMEASEARQERRSDGSGCFDRPNYQKIAQSKAYRNAVLRVIPQSVQIPFKQQCLKLGKSKDVTASVIDEKRAGVMAYATKNGLAVSRDAVYKLAWAQIDGLSQAAHEGKLPAFAQAANSLGLLAETGDFDPETGVVNERASAETAEQQRQRKTRSDAGQKRTKPQDGPASPEPPPPQEERQQVQRESAGGAGGAGAAGPAQNSRPSETGQSTPSDADFEEL